MYLGPWLLIEGRVGLNRCYLVRCWYEVSEQVVPVQTCQVIFTVASVLGSVACLSSLLLLWACLQSGHRNSLFRRMHLPPIPYAKIITMIYLKVLLPTSLATNIAIPSCTLFFGICPSYFLLPQKKL